MIYRLEYKTDWDIHFHDFDPSIQNQIWKKIKQLEYLPKLRHMGLGLPYFVSEAGQYQFALKKKRMCDGLFLWETISNTKNGIPNDEHFY